ncbi:MAG: alanine racemase [Candidatus Vogelbacteria bacterium]
MKSKNNLRTWIEVDTKALARNYLAFRKLLARPKGLGVGPPVKLMAVVKSNAYGHGLIDFSKQMVKLGADWLGVDSIIEAITLRQAGINKNILVLGYTQSVNFPIAVKNNIVVTISSLNSLRQILAMSRPPQFQLKLDTGMHRQGFTSVDLVSALALLARPSVRRGRVFSKLVGVYSHLASASNKNHTAETHQQIVMFENALDQLAQAGFPRQSLVKHLAATGGTIGYPEARYDLARIGLGFYGYYPSQEWQKNFAKKIKLHPALTWKTIISEVKTITERGAVGYDFTEQTKSGTKLAVCPIGYWHGFPRALSSCGEVMVRGARTKVIGRVSMDMIVIDVTRIRGVKQGDVVTLIGEKISAERLAVLAHTSVYEIITRLNPLIQKFYI